MLDYNLLNELLHHLSGDGGEADRLVVPWVLLLALFEDWSVIGSPGDSTRLGLSPDMGLSVKMGFFSPFPQLRDRLSCPPKLSDTGACGQGRKGL